MQHYGGSGFDFANSVQQTTDGGYIVGGSSNSFGMGDMDYFLLKTDASGGVSWAREFGGSNDEVWATACQTSDGGYIMNGGTYSFSPGYHVYTVKTDANGNSGCNQGNTSTSGTPLVLQSAYSSITMSSGGLVTAPATIVGSGTGVNTLCTNVSVNEVKEDHSFIVFPDPFTGYLSVSLSKRAVNRVSITARTILSETVFSLPDAAPDINYFLDLRFLPKGIYFLELTIDGNTAVKKIVKE